MSLTPACRARGYTLTECCVVVAIVAVAAAVAVPSFSDGIERRQLLGRASELSADLQWLRTEAVARQQAVRITVGPAAGGACYVMHTGPQEACKCQGETPAVCDAPAQMLKTVFVPADGPVRLVARPSSAAFQPTRGNATPTISFELSDTRGRTIRHVVSALGRVRSCASISGLGGLATC
jgi:type IV fimbrial biogenesis protein FimT